MNKQEFRQAVLADPDNATPEILEAAQNSAELKHSWDETKQLNNSIKESLQVTIPEGLASKLHSIPNSDKQNTVVTLPIRRKTIAVWSLAASVAFALGLSFFVISPSHNSLNGSELALAHFHHENPYSLELTGDISLKEVNAKLETFDTQMIEKLGKVTYANYCFFGSHKSVHMVMETVFGKVTMFVTAKDTGFPIDKEFGDERFQGHSWSMENVDITIINERGKGSEEDFANLRRQIEYSA